MPSVEKAIGDVRRWLEQVVIGLNLCPFAGVPYRQERIRFVCSQAVTDEDLLLELQSELDLLDATDWIDIETTILIVAGMLSDFDEYNQFLDQVDALLRRRGWEGTYQIASFHPRYRFEGTAEGDVENLTNCSPWPLLHILRESSIDGVLAGFSNPERIPERNMEVMRSLTPEQIRHYFRAV